MSHNVKPVKVAAPTSFARIFNYADKEDKAIIDKMITYISYIDTLFNQEKERENISRNISTNQGLSKISSYKQSMPSFGHGRLKKLPEERAKRKSRANVTNKLKEENARLKEKINTLMMESRDVSKK